MPRSPEGGPTPEGIGVSPEEEEEETGPSPESFAATKVMLEGNKFGKTIEDPEERKEKVGVFEKTGIDMINRISRSMGKKESLSDSEKRQERERALERFAIGIEYSSDEKNFPTKEKIAEIEDQLPPENVEAWKKNSVQTVEGRLVVDLANANTEKIIEDLKTIALLTEQDEREVAQSYKDIIARARENTKDRHDRKALDKAMAEFGFKASDKVIEIRAIK